MHKFSYKDLSIDFDARLIVNKGKELTLDPKAFNTLALLVREHHRVVNTEELVAEVWEGRPTTNEVVTASIGRVRKLFKDAGIKSEVIRTVHKVGYQFVLEEKGANESSDSSMDSKTSTVAVPKSLIWASGFLVLGLSAALLWALHFDNRSQDSTKTAIQPVDTPPLTINVESQKPTEIFFIRHAEKEFDGTDDPPLSDLGRARAQRWRTLLRDVNFDAIYTTRFIRNTQTVDEIFGKDLTNLHFYSALSFDIGVEYKNFVGQKVAIIGHSNTIPGMVNRLVTDHQYGAMDHRNYELIYHVTIDSSGGVSSNPLILDYHLDEHVSP